MGHEFETENVFARHPRLRANPSEEIGAVARSPDCVDVALRVELDAFAVLGQVNSELRDA